MDARWIVIGLLGTWGCGGGSVGGNDGGSNDAGRGDAMLLGDGAESGTFSCDIPAGVGAHICTDYSWIGPAALGTGFAQGCGFTKGASVATCARAGDVGHCTVTQQVAGYTVHSVTWFYDTAMAAMSACTQLGGTYSMP